MHNDLRAAMNAALKRTVVPVLRAAQFHGSLPHFRRASGGSLDLLTFQFDRYGGGFVIEIAQCPNEPLSTSWGKVIAPDKITAWDLDPNERHRIKPRTGSGLDSWFRFDRGEVDDAAQQVLRCLAEAESWFKTRTLGL